MSGLILPGRFNQQPQGPARVDSRWARRGGILYLPNQPRDLISGLLPVADVKTRSAYLDGVGTQFAGSTSERVEFAGSNFDGDVTIVSSFRIDNPGTSGSVIGGTFRPTGSACGNYLAVEANGLISITSTDNSNWSTLSGPAYVAGKTYRVVSVFRSGVGRSLFIGGVKIGESTTARSPTGQTSILTGLYTENNVGFSPMQGAIGMNAFLPYAPPDAEALLLSGNPWQMLVATPRRLWAVSSGVQTYTFTPSGGISFSGTGSTIRSRVKTPTGGLTFSGTAPSARGVVKTSSGGIVLAGTAVQVRSATRTASGGITLSGAATVLRGAVRTATGGLAFSGAASVSFFSAVQTLIVTPVGGMVFAGTAAIVRTCTRLTSGGISLAGNASVVLTHFGAVVGNWISVARHRRRD